MLRAEFGTAALLLVLAGCSASTGLTHSRATQAGMPCTEAARVARGALARIGYDASVVTAPAPGAPGAVSGRKAAGYDIGSHQPTHYYTAAVTITCSNSGATFEATTDEPLPGSLTFKGDFASAVAAVAARKVQRPRLAERPETGIVISVEPLRGGEARGEFDADLPADGITPVRLKIENRSERTYHFDPAAVTLTTQEGERAEPLTTAQREARSPEARALMQQKAIAAGVLAPAASIRGFLFFPASAYRRATVLLTDQESEEDEGFSVEF